MNPSTAFAVTLVDELVRCGLREVVIAPGSRSTPLAMAFFDRDKAGDLRLHVRIDERSASFVALGLAKASRRPVAVLCTSGTAAANFHPAVIEADEAGVPLLVLTADRPPELRGTGANQTIDQVKLYGGAVRWSADAGVPEKRPGMVAYWRSLACQAWAHASGAGRGFPGPVQLNLPLREPLVPDAPPSQRTLNYADKSDMGSAGDWPEPLDGRPGGAPWTSFAVSPSPAPDVLDLPWTERGVVVCGDGDYDVRGLLALAEAAGWPVLAEPSSGARRGPNALSAYEYLLATLEFIEAHRPDVIVSAGRPGLSRGQMSLLKGAGQGPSPGGSGATRHVVIAQGPDRWADPARTATDVVAGVRLARSPGRAGDADTENGTDPGESRNGAGRAESSWLVSWRCADQAARRAIDAALDADAGLSEPRLARDLAAALPDGALLWAASSLPIRDLDQHMAPRDGLRVLASRGASGIDGTASSAIGAALAHGGPAHALIGDLAFLHDMPGLVLGPGEPRPDLCLIVVNNDGGGIFSGLEQAAFAGTPAAPGSFERLFGTPHGIEIEHIAAAVGLPYLRLDRLDDLPKALQGNGLRVVEVATQRGAGAALRARLRDAAALAISSAW